MDSDSQNYLMQNSPEIVKAWQLKQCPLRSLWLLLLLLLLPKQGRLTTSCCTYSQMLYDGDPAEALQNLNSMLGKDYCNITQAFLDYSPEWRAASRKFTSNDVLGSWYWCAHGATWEDGCAGGRRAGAPRATRQTSASVSQDHGHARRSAGVCPVVPCGSLPLDCAPRQMLL